MNRKDFIKTTALSGLTAAAAPLKKVESFSIANSKDNSKIRIGMIGVGLRGTSHVRGLLQNFNSEVDIPAVCDISASNADIVRGMIVKAGKQAPELYTRGETDFERMVQRNDLDCVLIATPWLWHAPAALSAMKSGSCRLVGVEVPGPTTISEAWDLVKTSETTKIPCMILENACWDRPVLTILNMIRQGVFGEMVHARCAYNHNLLFDTVLLDDKGNFGPGTGNYNHGQGGESNWRTQHHISENRDLYPTHGIGPVAHWMDINRGNRFKTISSFATKSRRIHEKIIERGGKINPNADKHFRQGDMITSTIKTANEETIILTLSTTLPQVHDGDFRCQGTKGIWQIGNNSIWLEGKDMKYNKWYPFEPYQNQYGSVLYKKYGQIAAGSGEGGIDYFEHRAIVETIKRHVPPPIDVYDLATWSVIGPLSGESIARGGAPVEFPDFTGGKWITNKRIFLPEENGY